MYRGFLPSGGRKNDINEYSRCLGGGGSFEESGPPEEMGGILYVVFLRSIQPIRLIAQKTIIFLRLRDKRKAVFVFRGHLSSAVVCVGFGYFPSFVAF